LWLLPSGSDQVGEALARANLSIRDIGREWRNDKGIAGVSIAKSTLTDALVDT
jgi:hypothetical protein